MYCVKNGIKVCGTSQQQQPRSIRDFPFQEVGGSEKSRFVPLPAVAREPDLLGARVLGDGLGALADGVLGQLAGKQQAHGRLDLATRDRRAAVVVRQTRRLGGDALEDVVDELVHDRHGLAADARIGVDLLEHLVDVDGVAFPSPPLALLVSRADGLRLAGGLLRSLACWLRRHDRVDSCVLVKMHAPADLRVIFTPRP